MKNTKTTKTDTKVAEKSLIVPNTVIKLTIPSKQANEAYTKSLNKLAKRIKVAGFRKGMVPAKIAEEQLQPETIIEEALQLVVPKIYMDELKKSGKKPLTYPEFKPVSLEKGADWVIEAAIAEKPEVTLKDFQKTVEKANAAAQAEIEKQIKEVKAQAKNPQLKEDEKGGHTHADGTHHDHAHTAQEPTEQQKRDFTLQFIYRELITSTKPEIQELLVKEEVSADLKDLSNRLSQMNIPFEKFLEHRKMSFEDLSTELAAGALARLQMLFITDAIAQDQKISVEKKDIEAAFDKITDPELKKKQQSDPRYTDLLTQTILRQKVADYLLSLS